MNKNKLKSLIKECIEEILKERSYKGPRFSTLKKNKKPLSDEERKEVMDVGAVWHMGNNKGKPSPAVWKAVVKGKTWYVCNTHRAYQVRPTLKGAIKTFKYIETTA